MSLLSWLDNRTLFGCQCLLATMFALVFLWMSRAYPQVRGIWQVAWGFLIGIPCTLFMAARGYILPFLSVTVGNLLAITAFLLFYEGVVRFVGQQSRLKLLGCIATINIGVVFYFSEVRQNIVPRIVAMGLATALIRGAMAWTLLDLHTAFNKKQSGEVGSYSLSPMRGASGDAAAWKSHWGVRQILGSFLALLAVVGLERSVGTVFLGAPENFMERNVFQTSTMLLNVGYIAIFGVCFLIMASQEMIARSRDDSEHDQLSGSLNRRGIEARLAVELKRSNRTGHRLSIALVDIDRFKAINDTLGHAAGDAAIRAVAESMAGRLRDVDFVGRYGGDEFLLVLPHTALENARIVTERISLATSRLDIASHGAGSRQRLTLSIGLTEASPEDDAITLIARADEALYLAKSAGRDCTRMIAPPSTYPETAPSYQSRLSAEL